MRIQLARLNTPLVTLLVTALAYALFLGLFLRHHHYDPSFFVLAGDKFSNPAQVPPNLHVLSHSDGFDGQFYYRLALDPFTTKQTDFGITLDIPAYRGSRILYPLIVWILSLGHADAVPVVMILVNYLAVCMIGGLAGVYAQTLGRHALWGLFMVGFVGFFFTFARDLTEMVALTFLLGSLVLLARKHFLAATIVLTVGVLARETMLVWAGAVLLTWLAAKLTRKPYDLPAYYFIAPLVLYALWQIVLTLIWGEPALALGSKQFGIPLGGLLPFVLERLALSNHRQVVALLELGVLTLFGVAVLYALRSSVVALRFKLAWLFYSGAALCWTGFVWMDDWSFVRLLAEYYLFGAILLLGSSSRIKYVVAVGACAFWLFTFRDFYTTR